MAPSPDRRRRRPLIARLAGLALVVSVLTAVPYAAGARTDREIEQAISQLLVERHPNDTPDWWRGLGPQAPRVIIAMAERADDLYQRVRLVAALAHFPENARAVEYLREQAESTPEPVLREKAVRAIGISQGPKELDFLGKFLAHPDPQTRLAAAEALRGMDDAAAEARLEEYLKTEKAPFIAQRVRREKVRARPMVPVASTADRANPAFAGVWKGVLVHPEGAEGMAARPVTLDIRIEGPAQLGVTLVLPPASAARKGSPEGRETRTRFLEATGTRSLLAGKLPGDALGTALKSGGPLALSGELREQAGQQVLELSLPSHAATILLRKSR